MHAILTTPVFEGSAKSAGLEERDVAYIVNVIAADPTSGVIMPGTGGARKLRFAGRGHGKSGGYRTIHYYAGEDVPVFLLAVFGKNTKDNLSQAECNALRAELSALADDYRLGVKARVSKLKGTTR